MFPLPVPEKKKGRPGRRRRTDWQSRLLFHLSNPDDRGSERRAAPRSGVDGKTVRTFKRLDPAFAAAVAVAAANAKREAVRERAVARY